MTSSVSNAPCVVLLSGGQDSVTCLYWAKKVFRHVHAISFAYGQRHSNEVQVAQQIAKKAEVESHETVWIDGLVGGALTNRKEVIDAPQSGTLPNTFLPGRNLVFLTMALSMAVRVRLEGGFTYDSRGHYLVTGVCHTDYSGYPDCRDTTMKALERAMVLGLGGEPVYIETPLMSLTKAGTVRLAQSLGPDCWEALGQSITCYEGMRPGCGRCPSCVLRQKGFQEAGVRDPAFPSPEV